MARDTAANPRLGTKPSLPTYTGTTIDVDRLDQTYEIATYLAHRYFTAYPRPKANPLGKYANDPRSMVRASTLESYKAFINAGNGGSMGLTQKAVFESEHPGVVEAYEEWAAWAWSVNAQV